MTASAAPPIYYVIQETDNNGKEIKRAQHLHKGKIEILRYNRVVINASNHYDISGINVSCGG